MGLVKTRRLAAMHPPTPAASTFAKATVDESADKQAAAREGGDETAGEEGRLRATTAFT